MIVDGAAIVNMLRPGDVKTFSEYAQQVFLPYIKSQLQQVNRVDVVWDEYFPDSLNTEHAAREVREFADVLSLAVQFLKTGTSSSISPLIKLSYFPSWQ